MEGKPELCIDARGAIGKGDAALVLDDCARAAIRWTYDTASSVIRSDNNLCWILRPTGDAKVDVRSIPIGARACDATPSDESRFAIGGD